MVTLPRRTKMNGFTIVELLIVIVVIAILAAIVTVSYNGIRRHAVDSLVKDTAASLGQAMQVRRVEAGVATFATSLPSSVTFADKVGAATTATDATGFCINVTHQDFNDIVYSIRNDAEPKKGLCEGTIVAASPNYNYDVVGGQDPLTLSSKGVATANGAMNLKAETNDTWTTITLSWDAVTGATRYMLNGKRSTDSNWFSFTTTCGSTGWDTTMYSGGITPPATSYTMSAGVMCIPQNASQTHDYRVRYLKDGVWSDWTQLSISPLTSPHRTIPKIKQFSVTPASSWLSATFNWEGIGTFADLPGVKIRLNYRTSSTGAWYAFTATCGMTGWNATSYSGGIAPTATIFTVDHATSCQLLPSDASQTYEYRAQVYSGSEEGEWTTVSLNQLTYNNKTTMPKITGFTATPASDWRSIAFHWDSTTNAFPSLPNAKIRLNYRTSSTGAWYAFTATCGMTGWNATSYSGGIAFDATDFSAGSTTTCQVAPQAAGQTYEYRIQTYSGDVQSEWTTTQVSR